MSKIETICVQGGYRPGNGEPRQVPIIQSTTFKYDTSEAMAKLFDLEESGYFYTRLQNPTNDYVAQKICELEDKPPTFMQYSISQVAATTLLRRRRYTAERTIFLPLL